MGSRPRAVDLLLQAFPSCLLTFHGQQCFELLNQAFKLPHDVLRPGIEVLERFTRQEAQLRGKVNQIVQFSCRSARDVDEIDAL